MCLVSENVPVQVRTNDFYNVHARVCLESPSKLADLSSKLTYCSLLLFILDTREYTFIVKQNIHTYVLHTHTYTKVRVNVRAQATYVQKQRPLECAK